MSSERRLFSWNIWTFLIFGVLAGIVVFVLPAVDVLLRNAKYADEAQCVKKLLIACHSFALENDDGNFPKSLDELVPDQLPDNGFIMFIDPKTGERKPYKYFSNQTNTHFSGSPLIATLIIESKRYDFRIVGYVGGHVAKVR